MKSMCVLALFLGYLGFFSCTNNQGTENNGETVEVKNDVDSQQLIAKGKYLVTIGGCGDCHSPKIMTPQGPAADPDRLLSGYNAAFPFEGYDKKLASSGQFVIFNAQNTAFAGPWGVSFAANLTPDDTGIGNWSLEQFKVAMKEGKWKGLEGSRTLLPPMPWQNYKDISDEDISAIFAYLKSIKPVENRVPLPLPPNS